MISVNILIPSTKRKSKRRNEGSFEEFYSPGKDDTIIILKGDKNDG